MNLRVVGLAMTPIGLFLLVMGAALMSNGLSAYRLASTPTVCQAYQKYCPIVPTFAQAEEALGLSVLALSGSAALVFGGCYLMLRPPVSEGRPGESYDDSSSQSPGRSLSRV